MAMKNLKESQQVLKDDPSCEKRSQRSSSDTFSILREILGYNKEFQEKELKLKKEERTEFRDVEIQQQCQSNEVLRIFTQQSQAHSEQQTMMQQHSISPPLLLRGDNFQSQFLKRGIGKKRVHG